MKECSIEYVSFSFVDSVKDPVYLINISTRDVWQFPLLLILANTWYYQSFIFASLVGTTLVGLFIMKECWILLNAFLASIKMIMWFLIFSFVNVNIELSLYPWNRVQLIVAYDCFWYIIGLGLLIFFENVCVDIHQWYWAVIFFFFLVCLILVSG